MKRKGLPVGSPDRVYMFFMRPIPCQEDFYWISNKSVEQFKMKSPIHE